MGMATNASLTACREWFFAVSPVGIYLWVERVFDAKEYVPYSKSAEWGIATVFLVIAIVQLLLIDMQEADVGRWTFNREVAAALTFLFMIVLMLALTCSVKLILIQHGTAQEPEAPWIGGQWLLLVLVSLAYLWLKRLAIQAKSPE